MPQAAARLPCRRSCGPRSQSLTAARTGVGCPGRTVDLAALPQDEDGFFNAARNAAAGGDYPGLRAGASRATSPSFPKARKPPTPSIYLGESLLYQDNLRRRRGRLRQADQDLSELTQCRDRPGEAGALDALMGKTADRLQDAGPDGEAVSRRRPLSPSSWPPRNASTPSAAERSARNGFGTASRSSETSDSAEPRFRPSSTLPAAAALAAASLSAAAARSSRPRPSACAAACSTPPTRPASPASWKRPAIGSSCAPTPRAIR